MASTCRRALVTAILGLVAGLVLCPASAAAAPAGQGAGGWSLRGFGARIDTAGDGLRFQPIDPLPPVVEGSFTLGDGSGAGLSLEYRVTRRVGVEALALFADLDAELQLRLIDPPGPDVDDTRDLSTDLFGVGLDFHFTPGRRIDVYAGPVVAAVRYGHYEASIPGELLFVADFEDETVVGVTLGADIGLDRAGRWAVAAALRRFESTATREQSSQEIDVDPLIASLGVAYRWGGR